MHVWYVFVYMFVLWYAGGMYVYVVCVCVVSMCGEHVYEWYVSCGACVYVCYACHVVHVCIVVSVAYGTCVYVCRVVCVCMCGLCGM